MFYDTRWNKLPDVRLTFDLPPGWNILESQADGRLLAQRDGAELALAVDPLRLPPTSGADGDAALVGRADPASIRAGRRSRGQTSCGWPFELIEVAVIVQGQLVEARIVILFEFLHRVCALRFGASLPATLTTFHPEIMAIIGSARPDWDGASPVTISELWAPP